MKLARWPTRYCHFRRTFTNVTRRPQGNFSSLDPVWFNYLPGYLHMCEHHTSDLQRASASEHEGLVPEPESGAPRGEMCIDYLRVEAAELECSGLDAVQVLFTAGNTGTAASVCIGVFSTMVSGPRLRIVRYSRVCWPLRSVLTHTHTELCDLVRIEW